jgi:hypothetical protein
MRRKVAEMVRRFSPEVLDLPPFAFAEDTASTMLIDLCRKPLSQIRTFPVRRHDTGDTLPRAKGRIPNTLPSRSCRIYERQRSP